MASRARPAILRGMRIARVISRLNLGGPARQILASDPLLRDRGHAVRLFTGRPRAGEGDLFDAARERGLDVVRVPGLGPGPSPVGDLRALLALRRGLRAFAPEVVHTHASKGGALGRRAARAVPRAARVHTFHGHVLEGYFPAPLSRWLVRQERRLARETDRVVAVSHATADDLVRLGVLAEERVTVVPPGADLAPFLALARPRRAPGALRGLIGAGPDDFVAGCVGRLAEVKRPEVALGAFAALAGPHPRLHLAFVGDGPERGRLEREIAALPPEARRRAHLLGAAERVPEAMGDLDAVLLTSRSEGLPVALVEAAAAGLPAVALGVGGVAEVVAHERTGFVAQSEDELSFYLSQLAADRDLAFAMGHRARLRVAERHSAEALADRLEEVYRIAVEERACAS